MISEFLIGIGINGVYDIIKTVITDIFKEEDSELTESIYNYIDASVNRFFQHYGDKYGEPTESFLARQENYDIIVRHMFYSELSSLKDKINRLGFNDINADEEALDYFIESLFHEMNNNFRLNKIIAEKNGLKKINEIHEIVSKEKDLKTNHNLDFTMKYGNGVEIPFEKGRIYHKKFDNGSEQKFMIDEEGYHVEAKDVQGRITYCDVDFDGKVKYIKYPYDLSEFELVIPKEQVLKHERYIIPTGYGEIFSFKWGKKVIAEFNHLGRLTGLHSEVKSVTDYNSKQIVIMPDTEEREKTYEL